MRPVPFQIKRRLMLLVQQQQSHCTMTTVANGPSQLRQLLIQPVQLLKHCKSQIATVTQSAASYVRQRVAQLRPVVMVLLLVCHVMGHHTARCT